MARWEPNARERLEQAALQLIGERGYDNVTVAEVAAAAGLTERTFFRHFSDKREVLFSGAGMLQEQMVQALRAAPPTLSPLDGVARALDAAAALLGDRREFARQRWQAITAHSELQERELIKLASLGGALAAALRERGVAEPAASLAAEAGMAVFRVGFEQWATDEGSAPLADVMRSALADLKAVTGASVRRRQVKTRA